MKSHYHLLTIVSLLTILMISIILNFVLFNQGKWYYLQLNADRLDPLGLSYYPTDPEQCHLTRPDLTTVVFFGDSRTASWPSPTLAGFEFINRSIGAQTSAQAVLRFDNHVRPLRPDVIVIQTGINDLKTIPLFPDRQQIIIVNCKQNIEQLVTWSTDLGAQVILTTIFPVGEVPLERRPFWSDDVAQAVGLVNIHIRSLAAANVIVFDAYTLLVGADGLINPVYSQDTLHLNDAGYAKLNTEFGPVLRQLK